ncbi:MAG: hypothetical protein QOH67_2283 [Hyphomicrobiales bacterium]|jgi:hypothetical protein|nr:hypothetical protein [Hyphomicrobiales bacterium]
MLGAVKDEGTEQIPLFRVLARRWKSLGPRKHERPALSSKTAADEQPKAARAWIAKPRQLYAHQKIEQPKPSNRWNPWLWVK